MNELELYLLSAQAPSWRVTGHLLPIFIIWAVIDEMDKIRFQLQRNVEPIQPKIKSDIF
jgi:hypothetical protein